MGLRRVHRSAVSHGALVLSVVGAAHALLAAENVRRTLSRIDAFNAGSLAVHRKLGARDVARGWFMLIGPAQITISSVAPYWHVSLRDADAPQLHFDLSQLRPAAQTSDRDRVDA